MRGWGFWKSDRFRKGLSYPVTGKKAGSVEARGLAGADVAGQSGAQLMHSTGQGSTHAITDERPAM